MSEIIVVAEEGDVPMYIYVEYEEVDGTIVVVTYNKKEKKAEVNIPLGYSCQGVRPTIVNGKISVTLKENESKATLVLPEFLNPKFINIENNEIVDSVVAYLSKIATGDDLKAKIIREILTEINRLVEVENNEQ